MVVLVDMVEIERDGLEPVTRRGGTTADTECGENENHDGWAVMTAVAWVLLNVGC